jgi:hypothetical protein
MADNVPRGAEVLGHYCMPGLSRILRPPEYESGSLMSLTCHARANPAVDVMAEKVPNGGVRRISAVTQISGARRGEGLPEFATVLAHRQIKNGQKNVKALALQGDTDD